MTSKLYEEIPPVILAVDDDEVNLFMVGSILGKQAKVIKKSSGQDALDYLAGHSVDLVLMDYKMPGMNGLEVLQEMRRRREMDDVPVIIMTGEMDIELETEMFHSGAVDFVRKPFAPMVLIFILMTLQGRTRTLLVWLEFAVMVACYIVSYFRPDLVRQVGRGMSCLMSFCCLFFTR